MALSVIDVYRTLLPKTNCGDCGHSTCLAFASMVVSRKTPLSLCPHIDPEKLSAAQAELEVQHAAGKWTQRDMAEDALRWARERAASMAVEDLPGRIGGRLLSESAEPLLELPYFDGAVHIGPGGMNHADGRPLNRWEQVFLYNHMAQGGSREPTGNWKGFNEFPNTVSKVKSMKAHVEDPLVKRFRGRVEALAAAAQAAGGRQLTDGEVAADVCAVFRPLPRVPVMLLFWDAEPDEGYEAGAKLLFDETAPEHLDIESLLFLSERIRQLLCGEEGADG